MKIVTQIVHQEIFTFTPTEGDEILIVVSALREWLMRFAPHKVIEMTFPEESKESIYERHGIEPARMETMTLIEAQDPVIVGIRDDGTNILIDGGHRRAYWAERGVNVLRGWAVPEVIWSRFGPEALVGVPIRHDPTGMSLPQRRK